MSDTVLACPLCHAPAADRVQMPAFSHVDRYNCPACGLTTLREELVRSERVSILRGDVPRVSGVFGLLATLRPSGDLGDQNDNTSFLYQSGGAGSADIPAPASDGILSNVPGSPSSISYLVFKLRYSTDVTDQGPDTPMIAIRWTINSSGDNEATSDFPAPIAYPVFNELTSGAIPLDPNADPWSLANVNDLRMGALVTFDDLGSQEQTLFYISELWCEVWGIS